MNQQSAQITFLSDADVHLDEFDEAIENFDFDTALYELNKAVNENPNMPNVRSLQTILDLFEIYRDQNEHDGDLLSAFWHDMPSLVADKMLTSREAEFADQYIAKMAVRRFEVIFPDQKDMFHIGACLIRVKKYKQAAKVLRHSVTSTHKNRADLWGCLGDAAYRQSTDNRESHAAYLRALLIDPQAVDMLRLRHPGIKQLYAELCRDYNQAAARAMLPFMLWLKKIIKIMDLDDNFIEFLQRMSKKKTSNETDELHQFCINFALDQNCAAEQSVAHRQRMQELDGELFAMYMQRINAKKLEKRVVQRW